MCCELITIFTASRRGKQRGNDEDEDEEEETEGEELRSSEVVRREMGLEWMLKPASSVRTEGSGVSKAVNDEKDEGAHEEVMTTHLLSSYCHN